MSTNIFTRLTRFLFCDDNDCDIKRREESRHEIFTRHEENTLALTQTERDIATKTHCMQTIPLSMCMNVFVYDLTYETM